VTHHPLKVYLDVSSELGTHKAQTRPLCPVSLASTHWYLCLPIHQVVNLVTLQHLSNNCWVLGTCKASDEWKPTYYSPLTHPKIKPSQWMEPPAARCVLVQFESLQLSTVTGAPADLLCGPGPQDKGMPHVLPERST
jgi:hypothetical protein